MKRLFLLGLTALGLTAAPITISMPPQTGTFSGNVRGYWFTAPTNFDIVGLYVPTDASSGTVDIEVLKLTAPPPLFSSTTNSFTSLYRTIDNATAGYLPVSIHVQSGDIIGILGYRGNVNSYAAMPVNDTIFGNAVSFARLGMQFTLDAGPAHDVWTESSGSISRINFQYDTYMSSGGPAAVPEPSTLALASGALAALALLRRRKLS